MSSDTLFLNDENTLYGRMKTACQEDWHNYCHHPFVLGMADGSLPIASFRHYLQQDYLFLIHFARAYSLAVYKSDNLEDMRSASESVSGILGEMTLHLAYCREWGLTEKDVVSLPEARANMAYTRYVLERGMAGDILDLYTALSPCAVGYAEIGYRLKNDPDTLKEGNPYWAWIETYGGEEFLGGARKQVEQLEQLARSRYNATRMDALCQTFREATRLEIGFWQMGMDCSF
ncbi:thiaminase II [Endozoicomonas sp. GU-1]|uniref:thiaminase II n=1 Tax=Endozoicomonas sp. GU-1 TaxID=3009078 RepID=UPI0022B5604E|nr:thiaminase II [Endozoicomonas sp. GU-1]WBA85270.1 thiaminase II [Endozoicomonas sp. GU-1]